MKEENRSGGELKGNRFDARILKRIFRYVRPYIGQFYLLVFLTLLLAAIKPVQAVLTGYTVDHFIAYSDYDGLLRMTLILVAVVLADSYLQYVHTYLSGWVGQHVIRDIRLEVYKHVVNLRLKFFDNTPIGRLVTRNISDIETLAEVFTNGLANIIGDLLQVVGILGVMLYLDWRLTLVSLSTFPLLVISTYVFKEKMKSAFNDVRNAVSNLNTFVQEHITGMSVVQIFNSEEREMGKFRDINDKHMKAHLRTVKYFSLYFPIAEIIGAASTGLIVWYGSELVLGEEVRLGTLITFIMLVSQFFRPIRQIADKFNTLQLGIVSSERVLKLLADDEHLPQEGEHRPARVKGDVRFENVWFAYKGDDYVLKNIDFGVKAGETVAIVGATGAGKSSIINLLTRFYEINSGRISVDGRDVHDYALSSLRGNIGMVLQDVFLFSGSIAENITLGNDGITEGAVREAAELIGADAFIDRLPGGYDYKVMERGATLSVGQRQMISFVRAMVYDPRILILDEATSSVDTETEEMIQQAIDRMMKGRTAIVIAHRLATIQKADRIIVLDKGEIKEQGTHEELLARGGYYAQLYQMQYREQQAIG